MEKQFVVLGLGIFGSTLVKTLSQYGREVIAIDKNPEMYKEWQILRQKQLLVMSQIFNFYQI